MEADGGGHDQEDRECTQAPAGHRTPPQAAGPGQGVGLGCEVPFGGTIVLVIRAQNEQRARLGLPGVAPAMGKMGFEDQAVARLEHIAMVVDGVRQLAFQTVHEFVTGVDDRRSAAIRARPERHQQRLSPVQRHTCAEILSHAVREAGPRPVP